MAAGWVVNKTTILFTGVAWRIIWQFFWRAIWQKMANCLAIPALSGLRALKFAI